MKLMALQGFQAEILASPIPLRLGADNKVMEGGKMTLEEMDSMSKMMRDMSGMMKQMSDRMKAGTKKTE
jgi:hypothetical protein